MRDSLKGLLHRHREVISYLIFGVLTTVVGWGVYYLILLGGRAAFAIPPEEVTGLRYLTLYTAAQLIQWVCAVLFAFFTNRAWVFTDADKASSPWRQLLTFSAGRLATLGLDYAITFGLTLLLGILFPAWTSAAVLGKTLNLCEIASKLAAAVAVIVCNYLISKLLVFRKGDAS